MPPKTRNSEGRTEADYEGLQRYIKNKVAEEEDWIYPYEDWNYAASQNISSQKAPLPLPIDTSANSLLNSTPRGTLTISIPSVSNDGQEASFLTQIYPISDSSTTNIDSAISDWISHDNQKISSEVETTSYTHKDKITLSTDETSFNIQQRISSHITSKASPSSDDSNRQAPAAIPSLLKEKIAKLKTIINSRVGTLPCLPEPSRKESLETINQMKVFLTQPLQQCQHESPTSCHCNHRDQVPLPPSISYHIDHIVNLSPSSSQSVSKKPALLLHPVHDSSIEIPNILSEAIPSSDYDIHNIRPISKSGFVITLNSEDDKNKIKHSNSENSRHLIKSYNKNPGKRHFSMILYNVPSNISDEEIQSDLQVFQTNQCPLKIRFRFKGRLTNTRNLVFETPSAEFHKLMNIKKVPIKWKMYNVREFHHIKRCNFCQSFGHTTKDCRYNIPSCANCAGHHQTKECASNYHLCVNCYMRNSLNSSDPAIFHSAKDFNCPCFQTELARFRKS
ncbi:hypothetical protein AVEN_179436-1 [Araneus ventricosus]|uniref:Pre-C2HC domain-containing protein n=1 Tax=Araneus ventricosus TaxID=182803 RepID=A0A4Y2BEX4_ARAVE|nr:hypothetical protein AVEN_179436-1 [Araneus ventricosus]